MNDVTTTIFADFGNLLSHLNVFANHKHVNSCLICSNHEESSKNIYITKNRNNFYTTPTSSDLILLHSGNGQHENRQLIILNSEIQQTYGESVLERELQFLLHFEVFKHLEKASSKNVAIRVVVIGPEFKKVIKECQIATATKQLILIVPEYDKFQFENFTKTANILYYKDYESTLKSLVHISMITKQRIRIQDIKKYMNLKHASFQAKNNANDARLLMYAPPQCPFSNEQLDFFVNAMGYHYCSYCGRGKKSYDYEKDLMSLNGSQQAFTETQLSLLQDGISGHYCQKCKRGEQMQEQPTTAYFQGNSNLSFNNPNFNSSNRGNSNFGNNRGNYHGNSNNYNYNNHNNHNNNNNRGGRGGFAISPNYRGKNPQLQLPRRTFYTQQPNRKFNIISEKKQSNNNDNNNNNNNTNNILPPFNRSRSFSPEEQQQKSKQVCEKAKAKKRKTKRRRFEDESSSSSESSSESSSSNEDEEQNVIEKEAELRNKIV